MPPRWPRSARGWTGCRSPWSSPPLVWGRSRLLEPMRQYARERLVEAGESMSVEARHLAFSLELAQAADPEGAAAGPQVALDHLEADHDNLRAALAWALRHEPEQALRLAVH